MTIEKTLVLAKGDVLERGILGRILQRFEDAGLKIVGAKLIKPGKTLAKKHYAINKGWKKRVGGKIVEAFSQSNIDIVKEMGTDNPEKLAELVNKWSIEYLIKNPVLAMVVEGPHAIQRCEEMAGATEPRKALRGTIRGDFGADSILHSNLQKRAIYNLIHTSRSPRDAERETKLWFKKNELTSYANLYEKVLVK